MITEPPATASSALALVASMEADGLTPVMRGTRFYRHSFKSSQFGDFIEYLDERGTAGRCLPKNILRAFEFLSLGAQPERQRIGYAVVVAEVPYEPATLLEAAALAVVAMDMAGVKGPERGWLAAAVIEGRRIR